MTDTKNRLIHCVMGIVVAVLYGLVVGLCNDAKTGLAFGLGFLCCFVTCGTSPWKGGAE